MQTISAPSAAAHAPTRWQRRAQGDGVGHQSRQSGDVRGAAARGLGVGERVDLAGDQDEADAGEHAVHDGQRDGPEEAAQPQYAEGRLKKAGGQDDDAQGGQRVSGPPVPPRRPRRTGHRPHGATRNSLVVLPLALPNTLAVAAVAAVVVVVVVTQTLVEVLGMVTDVRLIPHLVPTRKPAAIEPAALWPPGPAAPQAP